MSMTHGYTNDEIRAIVYGYEQQPWGTRQAWLEAQGINQNWLRKWRNIVFDGDLDRGLIPRQGSVMSSATQRRKIAKKHEYHDPENEQLRARVRELEATNEALGKAIGLLHQLNEQEPTTTETNEPNNS